MSLSLKNNVNNKSQESVTQAKDIPPKDIHKAKSLLNLNEEPHISIEKPKIPIKHLLEDYFSPSSLPNTKNLELKSPTNELSPRLILGNKELKSPRSFEKGREGKNSTLPIKETSPDKYKKRPPSPLPSNESLAKLDNFPKEPIIIESARDEKSCKEKCQLCNLLCSVKTTHQTHLCASFHRCTHECDSKFQGYCTIQSTIDLGKSKQVGKREKW